MVPDRSPRKLISSLTLYSNTINPTPFLGIMGCVEMQRARGEYYSCAAVRVIGVLSRYYVHLLLLIDTEVCFRMHACHKIKTVES